METSLTRKPILRFALAVLAVLLLGVCDRGKEEAREAEERLDVLVIGIDGASWNVMRPLMARGELPNLKRLAGTGVTARFESIRPLFSPAIWTTLATGKMPDEHGIPNFHATRHDLKARRVWDVISEAGETVGVFGDGQRAAGVLHEDMAQAGVHAAVAHGRIDRPGNVL